MGQIVLGHFKKACNFAFLLKIKFNINFDVIVGLFGFLHSKHFLVISKSACFLQRRTAFFVPQKAVYFCLF